MIFLADQVTEYDKKRLQVSAAPQMELFVCDERSAIDWLNDFLKRRPSTYQELHPEFISQLGAGWKKHEAKPELSALLENNFIQFDGRGEVPPQIHSYLSSNHKDLRGLDKINPQLVAKAMDRWYVPDPSKAQDLEKKRETPITLSDEQVVIWLVEAVIRFTGKAVSLANLQSMPVLYPFVLDQSLAYAVSSSKKLELRSEGVGGQFVALRD